MEYVVFSSRSIMPINQNTPMRIPSKANHEKISAKGRNSFAFRDGFKRLSEKAKLAVEFAIERDESKSTELMCKEKNHA